MIYISGAITNNPEYKRHFNDAEDFLSKLDTVINPARVNSNLPTECTHDEYMIVSIAMLSLCDTIYMLRGWEKSEGAKEELAYALQKGYRILLEV